MARCEECGAPITSNVCEYCGNVIDITHKETTQENTPQQEVHTQTIINNYITQQPTTNNNTSTSTISKKSKIVALLLCVFLGYFGAHKFYVGKAGMGVLYLFSYGLFGFGWIIDCILIAMGSFKDKFGLPLKK